MSTDERIDNLTRRHEALTMHMELMTGRIERMAAETDARIGLLTTAVHETNETAAALLQIVASHQRRITELEDGEAAA